VANRRIAILPMKQSAGVLECQPQSCNRDYPNRQSRNAANRQSNEAMLKSTGQSPIINGRA
jgi:hypothetical protein